MASNKHNIHGTDFSPVVEDVTLVFEIKTRGQYRRTSCTVLN